MQKIIIRFQFHGPTVAHNIPKIHPWLHVTHKDFMPLSYQGVMSMLTLKNSPENALESPPFRPSFSNFPARGSQGAAPTPYHTWPYH